MNRRFFLIAAASPLIAGCTTAQIATAEARALKDLKVVSAKFAAAAAKLAALVPGGLAAGPLARIQANDAAIQAATTLGPALTVYAKAAVKALDDLLQVAEFVPGAAPYVEALRTAAKILHAFDPGVTV